MYTGTTGQREEDESDGKAFAMSVEKRQTPRTDQSTDAERRAGVTLHKRNMQKGRRNGKGAQAKGEAERKRGRQRDAHGHRCSVLEGHAGAATASIHPSRGMTRAPGNRHLGLPSSLCQSRAHGGLAGRRGVCDGRMPTHALLQLTTDCQTRQLPSEAHSQQSWTTTTMVVSTWPRCGAAAAAVSAAVWAAACPLSGTCRVAPM